MGLISATAAFIAPGYKGCPTLELVNAGEVALKLRPYESICQIILSGAEAEEIPVSRYQCLTKPTFARRPSSTG